MGRGCSNKIRCHSTRYICSWVLFANQGFVLGTWPVIVDSLFLQRRVQFGKMSKTNCTQHPKHSKTVLLPFHSCARAVSLLISMCCICPIAILWGGALAPSQILDHSVHSGVPSMFRLWWQLNDTWLWNKLLRHPPKTWANMNTS